MTRLRWDETNERRYENGVDHGVLYLDDEGVYDEGYAWNGLTTVTESPSGAEASPLYADNIKYLNLQSAEEFGATVEAFTHPDAFYECDGSVALVPGVYAGQQTRRGFGMSYRTKIGTDVNANAGYKLHLVYGAKAAPSEKAYTTVNDSPEATPFSWEVTTTPVQVDDADPTAILTIISLEVDSDSLKALEDALYGTSGTSPRLPLPNEVASMFAGDVQTVTVQAPTYNASTGVVTVPNVTGVVYSVNNEPVTGTYTVPPSSTRVVKATPASGYRFSEGSDDDFSFTRGA